MLGKCRLPSLERERSTKKIYFVSDDKRNISVVAFCADVQFASNSFAEFRQLCRLIVGGNPSKSETMERRHAKLDGSKFDPRFERRKL